MRNHIGCLRELIFAGADLTATTEVSKKYDNIRWKRTCIVFPIRWKQNKTYSPLNLQHGRTAFDLVDSEVAAQMRVSTRDTTTLLVLP